VTFALFFETSKPAKKCAAVFIAKEQLRPAYPPEHHDKCLFRFSRGHILA
jgi:hypothetical protein